MYFKWSHPGHKTAKGDACNALQMEYVSGAHRLQVSKASEGIEILVSNSQPSAKFFQLATLVILYLEC